MTPVLQTLRSLPIRLLIAFSCAAFVVTHCPSAMADGLRSSSRSCSRWRQDRLLIGEALQSHRFVPEPAGELQLLAEFPSQSELRVFHRTFVLALDAGEPISLFYGNGGRTCFVDRDEERKRPLLFPVFFLGQR